MNKAPTPIFPAWSDVTLSLFRNGFKEINCTSNSSLKSFLELLDHIPKTYKTPLSGMDQIGLAQQDAYKRKLALSELTEKQVKWQLSNLPMGDNQFHVVGNTSATEYLWTSENTKDLLGLKTNADFTFMKICGMDDADELYHPEDVEHIIRFGTCALIITALSEFSISPFTDYYEVNFRLGWTVDDKCKTILRRCYLSNGSKGMDGVRHFDTWRVTQGHDRFDHLHWQLHFSDTKSVSLLNGMFYILNCVLLGITPQEALLANLLSLHGAEYKEIFNSQIANTLGIEDFQYENHQTYFNQKSQLKKKIDKLIFNTTTGSKFKLKPTSKGFHFRCGQLGILGMEHNLKEGIFKNVCGKNITVSSENLKA